MKRIVSTLVVAGALVVGSIMVAPSAHANQAPTPKAVFLINGVKAGSTVPVIPNGASLHLVVDGSASSDADGWTTSGTGISQGGSCILYRGSAVVDSVQNPASPADCKFDLGTVTVSNSNVTQFSFWLNVVDASGARGSSSALVGITIHRPGAILSVTGTGVTQNGYQNNNTTISVPKGVPVQLYGDGSQSWSPSLTSSYLYAPNNGINAWNDPVMGISNGGSCAWNTSLSPGAVNNGSYDHVISSPRDPSVCGKSIDLGIHTFQTSGTYPVLKITDNTGMVSYAAVQINAVTPPANKPPVAVAKMSINGGVASNAVTVAAGSSATVTIDASSSTDPDGWTTATTGVSQGGKCEINTALSQANPPVFGKTVSNPASATACNQSLGKITFTTIPGVYTYSLLQITDASGTVSAIGSVTVTVTSGTTGGTGSPVATAQISGDNAPYASELWVGRGTPVRVKLSASQSTDPDGWTTAGTGISQGGKCEWNTDLNQGVTTYEKTISNPALPTSCDVDLGTKTFNDAPGRYIYPVLRITDASGKVSNVASVTIVVLSSDPSNVPPIAVAQFTENGSAPSPHIYVSRGVPVHIGLDASASSDPNGWNTPTTGVANGGSCQWNTNLDQSNPVPFQKIISNPSSPSACNVDLGTLVFNDPPGTYTYTLLRIIDASGATSPIAAGAMRHSLIANIFGAPAFAQSSDGTALVTVVDGPTPSPTSTVSPSPTCNPFGYNPNCPPPTPTPTPTETPSPTPCIPGEVCNTPSPTPCIPGELCDTPTPSPTPSESPTPNPCNPLDVACIVTKVSGGGDGGSALAATVTSAIARLFGLHPDVIQALVKSNGASVAAGLAAIAAALSAPFLAANILPSVAQWGQFFGSIFTVHRRKDRWGIVVDSDLGKPIANVVVQVFDAKFNQLKETQITGDDGQFGFLLPVGQYYIVASEAGFTFPAHKRPPVQLRDNERVYLGEEFTISEQDPEKIPHIVVPMDREQEVPKGSAVIRRYWERLLAFVDGVGFIFLFVGAGINTYLLMLAPGKLNILFEVLYLILFGLKLYIMLSHQRGIGTVLDRTSRKPMDLAIVRLYNAKSNRIVQTRVTNSIGRFFLLVPRGEYTVSVSKQGYKTLLIDKVQIKGRSSKALALDFSLEPETLAA